MPMDPFQSGNANAFPSLVCKRKGVIGMNNLTALVSELKAFFMCTVKEPLMNDMNKLHAPRRAFGLVR